MTEHVFKYLKIHNANDIAFDPCYQCLTSNQNTKSKVQVIKVLYLDSGEEIPPNDPNTRGKPVQVNYSVNYDHAEERATPLSKIRMFLL